MREMRDKLVVKHVYPLENLETKLLHDAKGAVKEKKITGTAQTTCLDRA